GGKFIQHLSRLPGNYSLIFSQDRDGTIFLSDSRVHHAQIVVKDVAGNSSVIDFNFRWDPNSTKDVTGQANTIKMLPEKENKFKTDELEISFSDKAFYDTVPFIYKFSPSKDVRAISATHYLHNYTVPVHDSFTVRVKPDAAHLEASRDRVVMQLVSNHKIEAVKGTWVGDWMEAKFRDLGTVQLLIDSIPPRITPIGWVNASNVSNKKSISFIVTDNLGEIKKFSALLDGNWLLFSRKGNSFIHSFDDHTSAGRHELSVSVQDEAGNITEKNYSFIK
ncbi:MAG TPA: hypothetical protein VLJ41_12240, partial [Segetibacter sp.]|nr:hypothetical protein [Segetibacter sp.]